MPPKDYIIYIDKDTDKTVAVNAWAEKYDVEEIIEKAGHEVIGKVSSGSQAEAETYGDQVLR